MNTVQVVPGEVNGGEGSSELLVETQARTFEMIKGVVLGIEPDGSVLVAYDDAMRRTARCDLLQTSAGEPCQLARGDAVVTWLPGAENGRGVVLGRLGRPHAGGARGAETPEELVIEARKGLTLKCGEGSITIREDGKILIKGKDLVSHAKRLNRIRGGSVQIN